MYKEFFNFYADIIFSFSFNKPCWDISLFFPKIFFKRKEKNKNHRRTSGKRNHGNLSPIPKIGEPFRKLVPHPLLRYPCLVLDFTLDPTNCFPRNEIKVSRFEHSRRAHVAYEICASSRSSAGKKNPARSPPLSKNLLTRFDTVSSN